MTRILLVGPLPPPMGGATRHFATLLDDLRAHPAFDVQLIDTSRGEKHSNWLRNTFMSLGVLLRVAIRLKNVDIVSYHASDRGMVMFGPIIVLLSKIASRPCVLRVFGGSFGDLYQRRSVIGKALLRRTVLSSDVLLLQTQRAVREIQGHARAQVVWFSTYIHAPAPAQVEARESCSRFVFLGHLWRTKGIETLLESAAFLPPDCTIDVFGPTDEYTKEQIDVRGLGKVRYRGFLSHLQVSQRLWEYDCLVLPTFHPNEGYPGVIAEAYAHGLPVITTNWLAIPEIADQSCAILIEPQNTRAFVAAVSAMHADPQRWQQMKRGAAHKAAQFDHAVWAQKFVAVCESLMTRRTDEK